MTVEQMKIVDGNGHPDRCDNPMLSPCSEWPARPLGIRSEQGYLETKNGTGDGGGKEQVYTREYLAEILKRGMEQAQKQFDAAMQGDSIVAEEQTNPTTFARAEPLVASNGDILGYELLLRHFDGADVQKPADILPHIEQDDELRRQLDEMMLTNALALAVRRKSASVNIMLPDLQNVVVFLRAAKETYDLDENVFRYLEGEVLEGCGQCKNLCSHSTYAAPCVIISQGPLHDFCSMGVGVFLDDRVLNHETQYADTCHINLNHDDISALDTYAGTRSLVSGSKVDGSLQTTEEQEKGTRISTEEKNSRRKQLVITIALRRIQEFLESNRYGPSGPYGVMQQYTIVCERLAFDDTELAYLQDCVNALIVQNQLGGYLQIIVASQDWHNTAKFWSGQNDGSLELSDLPDWEKNWFDTVVQPRRGYAVDR
jgi:hypothetical protein